MLVPRSRKPRQHTAKEPADRRGGGEAGGKAAPAGAGALRAASAAEGSPADAAAAGKAQAAEEAGEPCVDRQTLTDEGSHWLAQRARRRAQALSGEASLASAGGEPAVQQGPEGGLARKPVTVVFAHAASLEETSPSSASSSFALFLRSLLPRLFLLPADASSAGAAPQRPPAVSSKPAPAPLLSPTQHRHLPFDLVSVDVSAEPHLSSYLALSSVPSLVCFYDTKTYAVLTPGASDAALLRFLREAADIAEASPASPAETTPSARVAPTAVAEAVREARAEAAQAASVPQRERAAAAGVSAWISRKISETDAAALVGAWAERKRTQSLLARLKTAMRRRQATEVRKLRDELAADDRPEELELSRGRRLFAELQLHLERDGGADRAALSALLTEILGNALSLPSGLRGSAAAEAEARDAATAPRALYPGDARGRRADAHESWAVSPYAVRGFMNELETEPAFARLLARATVALFDQERAALNELEEWTARIEEHGDKSDWAAMCADMPESLRDVLETEEPVRPLDEAVHYAHVTLKNERDLARYRPSVFFLAGSPSLLDCPLRTLSRLCRIRAARQFSRGCVEEDALALAVRAYRLESQGAAEGSRDTAPAHVLGTWRDDEAALQTVEASYDKLGGNGQEDLFDQMACQRAGWPARTLVMAMYMALGAKHPAVQRSRAELEVLLGTDGFVPVIFPHTRARAGGKPIMMRGKSGKWHWLGPYWKPPWAPSNKVRWLAGREEWSWSNPAR
ncbi:hypothetical protein BESB_000320 [Besnoitia besnoiti]|uniref:Thioredoxin domain-containing protein n=1 Tax=Besnoitia besnoiti TaxID=94643 RepID=A0A2A9MPE5_BESBE|nr:hypothetical protein BESB_000320 [Besnoitia besnoiti]PFH37690.1 hypothetical protein BESB_000320 [Besnoitia besnoiti]